MERGSDDSQGKINETSRLASRALDFVLCFAFWQTRKKIKMK